MIRRYEVEDIIENALCDLNGKLSKPKNELNECTVFEADTENQQNGEILFSFKEDIFDNEEEPQKFRIRIEYAEQDMGEKEIKKYKMEHPVYYPTIPSLNTKCPVGYDLFKCSSKEHGMCCRTCANYNPLRMLYEKELKPGITLGVPLQVLLDDVKIQLDGANINDNEYTRKEKICPLIGDYCDEEHKNCDRCIAEEDAW